MSLLQYTSGEMFSSTELIRKSKMIFDKLNKDEIEKAVILRDGKPSFMLMDFAKYEKLITHYLELQEKVEELEKRKMRACKEENKQTNEDENSQIDSKEYEEALAKIEELDLDLEETEASKDENKDQQLKDFWE